MVGGCLQFIVQCLDVLPKTLDGVGVLVVDGAQFLHCHANILDCLSFLTPAGNGHVDELGLLQTRSLQTVLKSRDVVIIPLEGVGVQVIQVRGVCLLLGGGGCAGAGASALASALAGGGSRGGHGRVRAGFAAAGLVGNVAHGLILVLQLFFQSLFPLFVLL